VSFNLTVSSIQVNFVLRYKVNDRPRGRKLGQKCPYWPYSKLLQQCRCGIYKYYL